MVSRWICSLGLAIAVVCGGWRPLAAEPPDEFVDTVIELFSESDRDLRAIGFEQVRTEAKGSAATAKFAAQLPKLPADGQAGLLSALAERGDEAALPAIVDLLAAAKDESVRLAALRAVGQLGSVEQLDLLLGAAAASSDAERAAAKEALVRLSGAPVNDALAAQAGTGTPERRALLIEILAERRAYDAVPQILPGAVDADPAVRHATMNALGTLAGSDALPTMLQGVLKATPGLERFYAEKAIVAVANRGDDPAIRDEPLLAEMAKLPEEQRLALTPLLGKIGGDATLSQLDSALKSGNPRERQAAVDALAQWPNARVADRLKQIAAETSDAEERRVAFAAFVRLGALRDDQTTDQQRYDRLQEALALAKTSEERQIVLRAFRQAYLVESMRAALPYLDQPEYAQLAAETIVELAHHRGVREPHKEEFDRVLDRVAQVSTNETVRKRAQLYQAGQTWLRPQRAPAPFDPQAARALQAQLESEAQQQPSPAASQAPAIPWTFIVAGAVGVGILVAIGFMLLRNRDGG